MFDAQSIMVAVRVLQLVTKEEDRLAALALISSLRKRLVNPTWQSGGGQDMAGAPPRCHFSSAEQAAVVLLSLLCALSHASPCGTCACCMQTHEGRDFAICASCCCSRAGNTS